MYLIVENKNFIIKRANDWIEGMPQSYIPIGIGNTDYANFKKEILADEAQLQDAEGATMTAAEAKEFVATLP